jgi:hypothetical protein
MEDKHGLFYVIFSKLVDFLGVLAVPVFAYLGIKAQRNKNKLNSEIELSKEMILHHNAAELIAVEFLQMKVMSDLNKVVEETFQETNADRFLVLMAANGIEKYKVVSALYESSKSDKELRVVDAVRRYQNILIDDQYREMLYMAEQYGLVWLKTNEMEDCLLKELYVSEGVTESFIFFLFRKSMSEKNDVMLYTSLATHCKDGFSLMQRTLLQMQVQSQIRPMIKSIFDEIKSE